LSTGGVILGNSTVIGLGALCRQSRQASLKRASRGPAASLFRANGGVVAASPNEGRRTAGGRPVRSAWILSDARNRRTSTTTTCSSRTSLSHPVCGFQRCCHVLTHQTCTILSVSPPSANAALRLRAVAFARNSKRDACCAFVRPSLPEANYVRAQEAQPPSVSIAHFSQCVKYSLCIQQFNARVLHSCAHRRTLASIRAGET